jgi:hypothetical protein
MQTVNSLTDYARRGFNSVVELISNKQPDQTSRLCKRASTTERFFRVSQVSGFGQSIALQEGQAFPQDARVVGGSKDVYPQMWGNGFGYTKQAKKTDYYNLISKNGAAVAKGHMDTLNLIVANIYNRGFNSSYTGPDTLELFSTAHTAAVGAIGGNTQSNYGANSVSVVLSAANIEAMTVEMRKRKDHRGLKDPIMGPLRLLVDPTLEPLAHRICKSIQLQGTANNDTNYIASSKVSLEPETIYQFSSTTAFFLMPKDLSEMQAFMLTRLARETETDYKVETKQFIHTIGEEVSTFWEDWRFAQGSPGT